MTRIMQQMREELVRRNYAESTIRSYLGTVEDFRRYFQKRLDHMEPADIRRYQAGRQENGRRHGHQSRCRAALSLRKDAEAARDEAGSAVSETRTAASGGIEHRRSHTADPIGQEPVSL